MQRLRNTIGLIVLLLGCLGFSKAPVPASHGMVVSASEFASAAGLDILKQGGNAADAAAATAFVLAVVEPQSSGIGGGGFALLYKAGDEQHQIAVDFRERAPGKATQKMYLDDAGTAIERLSLDGPLAVGVPGAVAGYLHLHEKYGSGKVTRAQVMRPAIYLAETGFPLGVRMRTALQGRAQVLKANGGAHFYPGGELPALGSSIKQPELARTLKVIALNGAREFYEGSIAALIATDMKAKGGILTAEDLKAYAVREMAPSVGTYRGRYRIVSMPPPSSGGLLLVGILSMLENYDLASMGFGSADASHLLAETMRRAYADRAEHMGDPAFYDVPSAMLTSKEYAKARAKSINMAKASTSAEILPGKELAAEGSNTTHLSIVDAAGNALSMTTTINTGFGSAFVPAGTGIVMNNEMDDFAKAPGVPNAYGLVGSEANAILAGKAPLSSMSPSFVFEGDKLVAVLGTPGGSRIPSTVLETFVNVFDFGMNIAQAVAAPRIHHQWQPDTLFVEKFGFAPEVLAELRKRGHQIVEYDGAWCNMQAIQLKDGVLYGAADPRGEGTALGY